MNRHLLNPNCAKAFRLFNLALSLWNSLWILEQRFKNKISSINLPRNPYLVFIHGLKSDKQFSTSILSYHHHHRIVIITIVITVLGVVINIIVLSSSVPPTGLQILEKPTYVSEGKSRVVTCQVSFLNMLIVMMTIVMTLTIMLMMVKKEDGLMLIDDTFVSGHMYFFYISITV